MEGFGYILLILALYLLPELLKRLRRQQTTRYEYPPAPPSPSLQMEMTAKEEDTAEAANLKRETVPVSTSVRETQSVSRTLTSQAILQGVIWAEILKPPLSKRRGELGRMRRS
nr:hypothetical protein [uncultured Anaeromusa sp.]